MTSGGRTFAFFPNKDLHGTFTNSSLSWFTAMMIAEELLPVIYLNTFMPAAGLGFCFLVMFCFGRLFIIITEPLKRVNAHSCLWTQDMVSTSWQIKFPSFMLMISLQNHFLTSVPLDSREWKDSLSNVDYNNPATRVRVRTGHGFRPLNLRQSHARSDRIAQSSQKLQFGDTHHHQGCELYKPRIK